MWLQMNLQLLREGMTKGLVAGKVITMMVNSGKAPDFLMCIRDDRSDEDIFESIFSTVSGPSLALAPDIFARIVGQKPSKSKDYLDDSVDVLRLLKGLATPSNPKARNTAKFPSTLFSDSKERSLDHTCIIFWWM